MNQIGLVIPSRTEDEYFKDTVDSVFDKERFLFNPDSCVGPYSCSVNINRGIKYYIREGCDYILQINNDCEVKQDNWLDLMMETMLLNPFVGVIGAKILNPDGTIFSCGVDKNWRDRWVGKKDKVHHDVCMPVTAITGTCMLFKTIALLSLGNRDWLDPLFIKGSAFSDTDLCIRLKKRGWAVFYDGRAEIIHKKPQLQGKWHSWNHFYFHLKHPKTIIEQWQ